MTLAKKPSQARACAADECFDKPCSGTILECVESFPWSDQDTFYTKLFKAWDSLPLQDAATETGLLIELDYVISRFDNYIEHSDIGFRSWVKRHQLAIEIGLVETPTWPKLYAEQGGKRKWRDEVWVRRYSFLVHQRDVITKCRLQSMASGRLADKKNFFGLGWAYPRETVRTVQSKYPARLRDRWYEPLDCCLARMATESGGKLDVETLRQEFWGTGGAPAGNPGTRSDIQRKCEEEAEAKHVDYVESGIGSRV
ncbi:annexin A7 [Cordyceps militaris]|uniref:Annexin A7 n=1 Tax=Cordyceps militaris TaxID=73501 RepID=A0A2H4SP36_CORMI|nr:annexin A7 [Cordyceps militaris]